jgi:modulator of FtsH protease
MTDAWTNFVVGQLGASSALLGLLFVGVSINLTKILASQDLTNRALLAMILLLIILIVSSLLLVPGQPLIWLGAEILILGFGGWAIGTVIEFYTLQRSNQAPIILISNLILLQASTIPYLIAGGALVLGDANGLYWLAGGFVISLIKAVFDAWVLLIEINR